MGRHDLAKATMGEDLSDLGDLAEGLDNLELGDEAGETAAADSSGGESVELDSDLEAMLKDSGEGEAPAADEGGDAGDNVLGEGSLDDALGALGGGAPGGGGGAKPAAAPAPARRPAAPARAAASLTEEQAHNLEFLLDIKLHVTFEVGRSKMLISDLLTLGQGSVIELHRLVGDELDLLVNGKLIAKGEVVVVNEKFGCKITDIISPEDRIKHLGAV